MAFSRRFGIRLAFRFAVLIVLAFVVAVLMVVLRAPTAAFLAMLAALVVCIGIWELTNEGNVAMARFLAALDNGDLAQSFAGRGRGSGFDEVGDAYDRVVARLRAERERGAGARRFADALVDSSPTALLVLDGDETVRFANKAARGLFGRDAACSIDALAGFGTPFVESLHGISAGRSRSTHVVFDGFPQRAVVDATSLEIGDECFRIVSVRIVQAELDEAELAAQVDLVRVLTHEVMNSLTPVTSLAATAAERIRKLDPRADPDVADAQTAIAALARRAAELERFVESYKGFSEAPVLRRTRIAVTEWFEELDDLFAGTPAASGVSIRWPAPDAGLIIHGDEGLLTQVMLNVLKNAGEAASEMLAPSIDIECVSADPGWLRVIVADSGSGVDAKLAHDVFLPFFTTKRQGTGIGLSFARQIVLLHGGRIQFAGSIPTRLELLLPTSEGAGRHA